MLLLSAIFVIGLQPAAAIYGPSLARADKAIASQACDEANFAETSQILKALQEEVPADVLSLLPLVLKELRATPSDASLYAARAFCVHEFVPYRLKAAGSEQDPPPTPEVKAFASLGIRYFYYEPDGQWTLANDPVDLNDLATNDLDTRWGREAFLMMTDMGWSQGSCQEGPDQFRVVIQRGLAFLKDYPNTETSGLITLAVANAYATWWNLDRTDTGHHPNQFRKGADHAKKEAERLYEVFLSSPIASHAATDRQEAERRLLALKDRPNGSDTLDYYCADYED